MKFISQQDFETIVRGADVLLTDRDGPKVYRTTGGEIVKLVRIKRLWSSNLLLPHALRFERNAGKLARCGVACPIVRMTGRVPHLKRQMVIYRELPGSALREALAEADENTSASLVHATGAFISRLHEGGIYFRSIHFGNIIVDADEAEFALIDFLDLKVTGSPLSFRRRLRNGKHIFRYSEDRQHLLKHWAAFTAGYRQHAVGFPQAGRLFDAWRGMIESNPGR